MSRFYKFLSVTTLICINFIIQMSYIHAVLIKETNNIWRFDSWQYKMQLPSTLFGHSPQNFSLKNFLYFFLKKSALKEFLIFSQKSVSCFQESRTFLHFLKNYIAYILGKVYSESWYIQKNWKHIQNPKIFRTKSIFTIIVYSETRTCSEHGQTSTTESFAKIATQRTFKPKLNE